MAKKNNSQKPGNSAPRPTISKTGFSNQPVTKGNYGGGFWSKIDKSVLAAVSVVVVVFATFRVSLLNQFTNWDDPGYVTNQPIIKDLSADGLKNIFTTSIMGNYHPLTMLSYAFDYSWSKLDPYSFHLQSLLFHLATTVLVFWFIKVLTGRVVAAFVTGLLFGIHPMHVESVAWVAGRKDVVYGLFYIGSCIAYVYYLKANPARRTVTYLASVLLFVLSLLSKPVAVALPLSLLVIDYFEQRKWTISVLIEKVPFLLLAVAAGVRSIQDQKVFGALGTQGEHFNFFERIGLGGYALFTYLWKAIIPAKLLCFYPYPLKVGDHLPAEYYIYPFVCAVILLAVGYFLRKRPYVIFGVLFFLVNIALLLQFIPVGGAIIADRYSYIPYLGLFFILGYFVSGFFEPGANQGSGKLVFGGVMAYALVLSFMSNARSRVWYDGMSLWRDEIEVEPIRAPNGYNNLGFFYFSKFNGALDPKERKLYYDSSLFLLTRAIELQNKFINPYISLAELHRSAAQYDMAFKNINDATTQFAEAKKNYYAALKLDDSGDQAANAYIGLAILYSVTGNNDSALISFKNTLRLKPYNPEAHSNFANFYDMNGKHDSALIHYGIAIQQNPDIVAPYLNRARALQRLNRCGDAFHDFDKALEIDPDMGEIYYARSYCFAAKGNKAQALKDVEKAISLGFNQMDNNYVNQLRH